MTTASRWELEVEKMAQSVRPDIAELLVGCERQEELHMGRIVDGTVYILHSKTCLVANDDLMDCTYTHAMGNGVIAPHGGGKGKPYVLALHRSGSLEFL